MPLDFNEIEIEVSHCLCGEPEVRVLGSAFDRPRERFKPPYSLDDLTALLEEFDRLLLYRGRPEVTVRRKRLAEEIGRTLYRALLPGDVGATVSRGLASLETLRQEGRDVGQRIRISFGNADRYLPEIIGLPWELLCDPKTLQFPGSEPQTPIVRYLDLPKRIKPLATTPPLRVLAILCSPMSTAEVDLSPVDIPKHEAILRRAMHDQEWLRIHFLEPPTLQNVRSTLKEHKQRGEPFHAIHFLGHGAFRDDGEGELYFEHEDRRPQSVTGRDLARQLAGFEELRLAVLATCVGARMMRRRGQHPFTGAASALITRIPAALAMQFPISEDAASQFTSCFYQQLAAGHPVDEAVAEGRLRMTAADPESFEWACPVLMMRTPDGRILDLVEREEMKHEELGAKPQRTVENTVRAKGIRAQEDIIVAAMEKMGISSASDSDPDHVRLNVEVDDEIESNKTVRISGVSQKQG